jgi:hypothetical protein
MKAASLLADDFFASKEGLYCMALRVTNCQAM